MGANFWCKSLGVRGGKVMDEIDTFITAVTPGFADRIYSQRYFKLGLYKFCKHFARKVVNLSFDDVIENQK